MERAARQRGQIYLPRDAYAGKPTYSSIDPICYQTVIMDDAVLRFVRPNKKAFVAALFRDGIMDRVADAGLIPETGMTNYYDEGTDCILTQRKLTLVNCKYYSFSMIKDCLKCVVKLNSILRPYGYILHDPHLGNVSVCDHGVKYMDIGSIRASNRRMTNMFLSAYPNRQFLFFSLLKMMIEKANSIIAT